MIAILFGITSSYIISVIIAISLSIVVFKRNSTKLSYEDVFFYVYFSVLPVVNIMHIFGIMKDLKEDAQR